MKHWNQILIVVLVILYLLLPDLLPGPIDDALVLLLTAPMLKDGD